MKTGKAILTLVFLSCSLVLLPNSASATHYYVDNVGGSDSNSGTSTSAAWKTIAHVNSRMSQLVAGDIVSFKRGGTWTDLLTISKSGISGNPITFDAYGMGSKPIIRNPDTTTGRKRAIEITASHIVIDGIMVKDTVDRGIDVRGSYNVIKNVEITNVGVGVDINGTHNFVTQSHFHDLIMSKNTSTPTTDDFGAFGVTLKNTDNEVSYNRFENCRVLSYDVGYDGGAVEIFGNGDRSYVHHNWAYRNQGFMEVGGSGTPTVSNVRVEYNIAFDTGRFTGIQNSGTFGVIPDNFKVQNNTIVETNNSPITGKYASLVFKAAGYL